MPPTVPASGIVNLIITGDAAAVEEMLAHIELAMSARVLGGWLNEFVTPFLRERAAARFDEEGDDVVGRWSPLLPSTVQIREQQGFPGEHPINVRTGELRELMTRGNDLIVSTPFGSELTFPDPGSVAGELEHKVVIAQMGGQAPNAQQPTVARPVIGVNERDLLFVLASLSMMFTDPPDFKATSFTAQGGQL